MTALRRILRDVPKSAQYFLWQKRKMSNVKEGLMCPIAEMSPASPSKITIVGAGQVGIACAISIMAQGISSDICLVDICKEKMHGEMLDFQHGTCFLQNAKISASTDYSCAKGSRICILSAGVRQEKDESRMALLQRNVQVVKEIIPKLMKYCPDAILLLVLNPVDVMTYVAWKLSCLPASRVIGSGTHLDTARFRFLLSQRLRVAPRSCHAFMIGEHGNSSVVVWSGVSVGGVRLRDLHPTFGEDNDPEKWKEIHETVIKAGGLVRKLKGASNWAVALSTADICKAILTNNGSVICCTTCAKGYHGIEKDVFLSLPCVLSSDGVTSVIKQTLAPCELEGLQKSASILGKAQDEVKI